MMYHPADTLLPAAIAEAEAQARLDNARLEEKIGRVTETKQQLEKLVEERRERIASGKVQRAALLQRDWKKMPASEWEDFVVEVARTLGASVERAKRIDDEGANLIVVVRPAADRGEDAGRPRDDPGHRRAESARRQDRTRLRRRVRSSRPAASPALPRTTPPATAARSSAGRSFPISCWERLNCKERSKRQLPAYWSTASGHRSLDFGQTCGHFETIRIRDRTGKSASTMRYRRPVSY